ncbi:hypothetical protein [uncultured Endozoicomonas sp.]|uniref:hypothetical protein n=1 Tax=uncultured Endozoicomonas sp. TaxID=432652 RepID=UPI0026155955|nr:hypothetical protein [uncultured Endozoicomonas sp.]
MENDIDLSQAQGLGFELNPRRSRKREVASTNADPFSPIKHLPESNSRPNRRTSTKTKDFSFSNALEASYLIDEVEGSFFNSELSDIQSQHEANPDFNIRDRKSNEVVFKGLNSKWQQTLVDQEPVSQEAAEAMAETLRRRQQAEADLQQYGMMTNLAAAFLADFNTKEDLAAQAGMTAVTLGFGTVIKGLWTGSKAALRLAKMNRVAKYGLVGAATNAGDELLRQSIRTQTNELYNAEDALKDTLFSAAVGGVLGGTGAGLKIGAEKLLKKGKPARAANSQAAAELVDEVEQTVSHLMVDAVEETSAPQWRALKLRMDLGARSQKLDSSVAKREYSKLLTDAVDVDGKADGADYLALSLRENVGLKFKDDLAAAFKLDKNLISRSPAEKAEFMTHVYKKAVTGAAGESEAERMAIGAVRSALDTLKIKASNAGVEGADFKSLKNYVPRIWKGDKVKELIRKGELSIDSVKSALRNAVSKGQPDKSPDEVEALIERIVKGGDLDPYAEESVSSLKLRDGFLADEDRFKKRIELDMSATSDDGSVSVFDLVDTDLNKVIDNYTSSMSGRIALAEKGFKSPEDAESLLRSVISDLKRNHKGSEKDLQKKIKDAEKVHSDTMNGIMGRQQRDNWSSDFDRAFNNRVVKSLKSLGNWTMLDYSSFAALPDIANSIGKLGVAGVREHIPLLSKLTNPQRKSLLNELEVIGLHLGDSSNARYFGKALADLEPAGRFDSALNTSDRLAFKANLLSYIEGGVNKALSLQVVGNIAKKGKITPAMRRAMGLSVDEAAVIDKHLSKVTVKKGLTGKQIKAFNFDQWVDDNGMPDQRALDLLARGAKREADRANAKAAVGEKITGLDAPLGGVMLQYMNAVANSWQRITLRTGYEVFSRGQAIDMDTRLRAVQGALLAGMVSYLSSEGKQYVRAIGDKDKQKQLKKRTTKEKTLNALAYTPQAGALLAVTEKLSPILYQFGIEVNEFARYQKPSSAWVGAPIISQTDQIFSSAGALLDDDKMTVKEKEKALKLLPFYEVGNNIKNIAEDMF